MYIMTHPALGDHMDMFTVMDFCVQSLQDYESHRKQGSQLPKAAWQFRWNIAGKSIVKKNVWWRNVHQDMTDNSPSNIFYNHLRFQSYCQFKYCRSRQQFLEKLLSVNRLKFPSLFLCHTQHLAQNKMIGENESWNRSFLIFRVMISLAAHWYRMLQNLISHALMLTAA